MLKMQLDPTIPRVVIVACLVFIYSLTGASGLMVVLQDRMPEPHEWVYFLLFALGTVAVYCLTFLGVEAPKTTPTEPTPQ
jgi:uncharacterized membrane protein YkvI